MYVAVTVLCLSGSVVYMLQPHGMLRQGSNATLLFMVEQVLVTHLCSAQHLQAAQHWTMHVEVHFNTNTLPNNSNKPP